VLPLAPFGRACARAGHEVLVVAQRQHEANVRRTGLAFAPVDDPPRDRWMPLMANFARQSLDVANARMVSQFFAGLDTTSALPGLEPIVEQWRPELIVRESWEFASTLVAEAHGIALARDGLGLAAIEDATVTLAAPVLDEARARFGLPADPTGERLRAAPYFTMMPAALEDPAVPAPTTTYRFGPRAERAVAPLPDWWPGNEDPLVYVTLGSVAPDAPFAYFPTLYRALLAALEDLPVRILLTIGTGREPRALGPVPANVHVERWVAQDAVVPHAMAVVGHGGFGTTLGALAHGVPSVVLPLFSMDQWANADAVARVGAGVALTGDRATREVLALPADAVLAGLRPAIVDLLVDVSYARHARAVADSLRAVPPVAAAVPLLTAIAEGALAA
jgi:UDP:flavonoid glycosyltransferase YjiC (YdhE family)